MNQFDIINAELKLLLPLPVKVNKRKFNLLRLIKSLIHNLKGT